MEREIKIENQDYAATFVLNNGSDYDICQLFEKDKQYSKVVLLNDWVRRDFFTSKIKEKDEEIQKLKRELAVNELCIDHLKSFRTYKFYFGKEMVQQFCVTDEVYNQITKQVCDAVYKLTRELMAFGYDTVKIKDVETVLEQFDRGE